MSVDAEGGLILCEMVVGMGVPKVHLGLGGDGYVLISTAKESMVVERKE